VVDSGTLQLNTADYFLTSGGGTTGVVVERQEQAVERHPEQWTPITSSVR
jgi:hypothetical protein